MNKTLEQDLELAMSAALDTIKGDEPRPLRPVNSNGGGTLSEQLEKMENVQQRLKERVRQEKMHLLAEHDRRWTETQHRFAQKIHEEVTKLERARDEELRRLADDHHEKTREIDFVAQRLSADI
jgi:hypothetical protein